MKFDRVMALGAHTDDIELGCGGLLSRLLREGSEIVCVAFSSAEASIPESMPAGILRQEFAASMRELGKHGTVQSFCRDIPVRHFPEHRQRILEDLVTLRKQFAPDLVLTMNSRDTHQDHQVIHEESVRAFRGTTLLGYELPWNQQQNVIELFAELEQRDVDMKASMLQQYTSQVVLGRPYMTYDFVKSAAMFRGFQARSVYAEAYEVVTMQWRVKP